MGVPRLLITGNDQSAHDYFKTQGFDVTFDPKTCYDGIVFTGGLDIAPILYGQRSITKNRCNFPRDLIEIDLFKRARSDMPKIGICRGMQLGNVLCGGSMWQDVDRHEGSVHSIKLSETSAVDGRVDFKVNSYHHQMAIPGGRCKVLATAQTATKCESDVEMLRYSDSKPNDFYDIEALAYPEDNFFGVQWHPEWGGADSHSVFIELLHKNIVWN